MEERIGYEGIDLPDWTTTFAYTPTARTAEVEIGGFLERIVVDRYDPETGQPTSTTVESDGTHDGPEEITSYGWHPTRHLETAITERWVAPGDAYVEVEEYTYDDQWRPIGYVRRFDEHVETRVETSWRCP